MAVQLILLRIKKQKSEILLMKSRKNMLKMIDTGNLTCGLGILTEGILNKKLRGYAMSKQKLMAIDGNSILNRAFYGFPNF